EAAAFGRNRCTGESCRVWGVALCSRRVFRDHRLGALMDIRRLRYFIEIVEAGSLSKAAERLRIAQPALSQTLQSLEAELGVGLVVRHSRGVVATETGLLF